MISSQSTDLAARVLELESQVAELKELIRTYHERHIITRDESQALAEANVNAAILISEIEQKSEELRLQFRQLEYEAQQREKAERELAKLNQELEVRADQRTTELEHQREKAVKAAKELQDFAYVASHDLQEPLRMVTSYLQLLDRRCGESLDSESREFMDFAVDGATRMQQMISDILSFSRVDSTGNRFATVDCDALVQSVLQNLESAILESGAEIDLGPLPTVVGDQLQLSRLFQNLIHNAIKFTLADSPPRVKIAVEPSEEVHKFSIIDQGIGVDPKHKDRIFIMFQRLHTRTQFPGSGVGLPICKRIVERHGGKIWVDSEPGKGATFHFTLLAAHS